MTSFYLAYVYKTSGFCPQTISRSLTIYLIKHNQRDLLATALAQNEQIRRKF